MSQIGLLWAGVGVFAITVYGAVMAGGMAFAETLRQVEVGGVVAAQGVAAGVGVEQREGGEVGQVDAVMEHEGGLSPPPAR